MEEFNQEMLAKLYVPAPDSHKGQNGKVLIIGGSTLFHGASLWPLEIASRIVDMVFYASVPQNNQIVALQKQRFHNGIVVPQERIEDYMTEADCILIGPGMVRAEHGISNIQYPISNIHDILGIEEEGEQTYYLTKYLLEKYPSKKWVIDAGALQMMHIEWLHKLTTTPILTPHQQEFERVFAMSPTDDHAAFVAKEYGATILLKGHVDTVCSKTHCLHVAGGNAGMTKGGTGDVLAGLTAALYSQNDDALLVASCASYINKKAGESLYEKVGLYFNATDVVHEIPVVMRQLLLSNF